MIHPLLEKPWLPSNATTYRYSERPGKGLTSKSHVIRKVIWKFHNTLETSSVIYSKERPLTPTFEIVPATRDR
jgi:hypothetical protein